MSSAIKREVRRVKGRPLVLVTGESRLAGMPGNGTSPTAAVARDEALRPALELVAELPTPQRDVLLMRETNGLTFAEIAAITGRREATERRTHCRVLQRLRRKLSQHFLSPRNDR
jgi:RNA polymerase sigma-70 factor (ECF subfamily)